MCWSGYNLPKNTLTGLKRNGVICCVLMRVRLIFLGLSATDSLSDVLQTLNSSHSTLHKTVEHGGASIMIWGCFSYCWSYLSHTRDHGSAWVHQNTGRSHVAVCQCCSRVTMPRVRVQARVSSVRVRVKSKSLKKNLSRVHYSYESSPSRVPIDPHRVQVESESSPSQH